MRLRLVTLLTLATLLQGCGTTMLRASCENPRITNVGSPSSYIVMLPYRYAGTNQANADAAHQFNQIARFQVLQGAVRMRDTQITLIDADPAMRTDPRCGIENVYDRVVENRSGLFWRRLFHSAVFVWGEIFDRDDGFVVQSHMRVFWNGAADREFEVQVDSPSLPRPLRFGGDLPSGTISFPAQTISRAAQAELAGRITSSLQIRKAPRLDATAAELPKTFSAVAWKRPWLQLQNHRTVESVWLLIDEPGLGDRSALPEALFAQAMAGYLNFRVKGGREPRQQAIEALGRFRATIARSDDAELRVPLALADVIEGTLGLPTRRLASASAEAVASAKTPAIEAQSQTSLFEAARRLPSNGEVLNLAAISRIPGCCDGDDAPARIRQIQQLLERAEVLERGNLKVASNVLNWYRYLATRPAETLPFSRAELGERTRAAQESLAEWSSLASR